MLFPGTIACFAYQMTCAAFGGGAVVDTIDKSQRRDFEDQQNELAGRETGRMARFGVGAAREHEIKEKKRSERAYRDALDRLLLDPEYRRLYEELGSALGSAETESDSQITTIREQLSRVEEDIAAMERDAARGPDGRPVFRSADGRVVYADGSDVPAEIAEGIIWPEGAPSAEDFFASKDRQTALQHALEDWMIYRNDVLGGVRDRYDDRDNPMSKDAMRDALDEIESHRPPEVSMETTARQEASQSSTPQVFPDFN